MPAASQASMRRSQKIRTRLPLRRRRPDCPASRAAAPACASGRPPTPSSAAASSAPGLPQRTHVIDHVRAGRNGGPHDLGLAGIDRNDAVGLAAQRVRARGQHVRAASPASTATAPGRVDSPPMSSMEAPSASIFRAARDASSAWLKRPPSENESGVTLRMPMTAGHSIRSAPSVRIAGSFGIVLSCISKPCGLVRAYGVPPGP